MAKAQIGDIEIDYEVTGSGPPVLLAAGLGGLKNYWDPQMAALVDGYTVIRYDHRGMGGSTHWIGSYSVDQMADDALGLMDALDIGKVHLIGHSTGGAIGQVLGSRNPDRISSLLLASTWPKADDHFRWAFSVRSELIEKGGAAAFIHAAPVFLFPPWFTRDNADKLREIEKVTIENSPPPEILQARIDAILAFDCADRLGAITAPTLVTVDRDDILTPVYFSEHLAAAIPGAALHVFEGGAHANSLTVPDDFNKVMIDWLAGQTI